MIFRSLPKTGHVVKRNLCHPRRRVRMCGSIYLTSNTLEPAHYCYCYYYYMYVSTYLQMHVLMNLKSQSGAFNCSCLALATSRHAFGGANLKSGAPLTMDLAPPPQIPAFAHLVLLLLLLLLLPHAKLGNFSFPIHVPNLLVRHPLTPVD